MGCAAVNGLDTAGPAELVSIGRDTVLLLHGSAGSGALWRPVASALQPLYRCLTPDLIGYGKSVAWPPGVPFDLEAERLALEPVLACCSPSLHLVGYSYGGVVALHLALARPQRVRTLTLIEPVAFNVLRDAADRDALARLTEVRNDFLGALRSGDRAAAMRPFIDFWTGAGAWDALPVSAQSEMLRYADKIALDWQAAFAFAPDRQRVAGLGARTLLIRGDQSPGPMVRLVDALHALMPGSAQVIVSGANHLLPLTRPSEVTQAVLAHLHADAERRMR